MSPRWALWAAPLEYLTGDGDKAFPIVALTWGLIVISLAVVIVIAALVAIGTARRAGPRVIVPGAALANVGGGVGWISWGVGLSCAPLLVAVFWTMAVIAKVNEPALAAPMQIEVTGEQWWWRVRYLSADPAQVFTTANEIHIPVGRPVRVHLIGGDVIHSFWVPALTGKTDTIPGLNNTTWMEAAHAGRFFGQCTEYCGVQHAHMGLFVIADPPAQFEAWRQAQIASAPDPSDPRIAAGERLFVFKCGACHTVRGSEAGGTVAPDLTHLMSRATIAAGTLTNTPANLSGWIANPQVLKPGTLMPTLFLSGPQLASIRAYLETLR